MASGWSRPAPGTGNNGSGWSIPGPRNDNGWSRPGPRNDNGWSIPGPGTGNNGSGWSKAVPTSKLAPVEKEQLRKPGTRSNYVLRKQSSRRTKRNNTNTTLLENNISSIDPKFKSLYTIFMNRYANSLKFAYSTTDPLTRANQYIQSIANYINEHSDTEKLYRYGTPYKKLDVVTQLINSVLKYKTSLEDGKINKHSFINCHGGPTFVMKTVPKGYTLVMITPHNRLGLQNKKVERKLINMMIDDYAIANFKNDPICYDKNKLNGLFSHASVYFENQFYFDVSLSGNKKYDDVKMAIYNYQLKDDNIIELSTEPMFGTLLSELLETGSKKIEPGIIFVSCCRDLNESTLEYGIANSTIVTRYEHLLKIINQSTFAEEDIEKYNSCYKINKTDRLALLDAHNAPQSIKDLRTLFSNMNIESFSDITMSAVNKMIQFFSNISFSDRSLSTSINILDRLDFDPELIDLYASINMYSNHGEIYQLMTQYFNEHPEEFESVLTLTEKPLTGFNIDPFTSYLLYKRVIEQVDMFGKFDFTKYNENQILYFNNVFDADNQMNLSYLLDELHKYKNLLAIYLNNNGISHLPMKLLTLNKKVKLLLLEGNSLDFSDKPDEYNYNITKLDLQQRTLPDANMYIVTILREYLKKGTLLDIKVKSSGTLKNILGKYKLTSHVNINNNEVKNEVRYAKKNYNNNNNNYNEPQPTGPEDYLITCDNKKCGRTYFGLWGEECPNCGKKVFM